MKYQLIPVRMAIIKITINYNTQYITKIQTVNAGEDLEKTPGVGDGQGGLACCDSWGRKELDTTEQLN